MRWLTFRGGCAALAISLSVLSASSPVLRAAADEAKPAADTKKAPLSPAQQDAVAKLQAKGALVIPLAANSDALVVSLANGGKQAGDAELQLVKQLPHVEQLDLRGTGVTDNGLAALEGQDALVMLHLENTAVTDAGLAHLKGLTNLQYLNLFNTAVTDKGVGELSGLKNLKKLYLWQTKVTDAGAAGLKKSLPELYVNRGEELAVVPPPAAPAPAPAVPATPPPPAKKDEKKADKPAAVAVAPAPAPAPAPVPAKKDESKKDEPKPAAVAAGFTRVTVTHTFINGDGTPAHGKVVWTLTKRMTNGGVSIVPAQDITSTLDGNGHLTQVLAANDDPGTLASTPNVKWEVTLVEEVNLPFQTQPQGKEAGRAIDLGTVTVPHNAPGGTIDLGTLLSASPAPAPAAATPAVAASAKPVNTKCPLSGDAVDAAQTVVFEGKVIGLCCDKCKAKFQADPRKYIDKVVADAK